MRLKPKLKPAKIMIVGEAPGEQEELLGEPFVGTSGQELNRMLRDAGIDRNDCAITNVFWTRPPGNKIEKFCAKKKEVGGRSYPYPPLRQGKYFKPQVLEDVTDEDRAIVGSFCVNVLERLAAEIDLVRPNLIIALGNTACWALLGQAAISKIRGTVAQCALFSSVKVIPTYHPAAIMRQWALRPIMLSDLMKARREAEFPELIRPQRFVHVNPTREDLDEWRPYLLSADLIGVDIETGQGMIKCVGFSVSDTKAFVVPFWDPDRPGFNYWEREEDEIAAWEFVRWACALDIPKVGQNGLYDIQYLWRAGVPLLHYTEDTMLMAHAQQPELPKGLGWLGSIYTNEASWKLLRPRSDEFKRDE